MSQQISDPLIEWTDYALKIPEWFIENIQADLTARDIRGLTNDTIDAIRVGGEHPLVTATGAVLAAAGANSGVEFSSLLPRITVVESDEDEPIQTMGRGLRQNGVVDLAFFDSIRSTYPEQAERQREGLLTDAQIDRAIDYINVLAAEKGEAPESVQLITEVHHYWIPEVVFISLWTNTLEERAIVGAALRSVVFGLKDKLALRNVRDIGIRTSKGLVNMNFGRILHGQETEFRFNNWFRTFTVSTEMSLDGKLSVITELTLQTIDPPVDAIKRYDTASGDWEPETDG